MYVTRQELTVAGGQGSAYLERSKRFGELVKSQEGFEGRMILNSFGYPAKHAALTTWKSREAARAFGLSAEVTAFMKENPLAGIGTVTRPMEAYATIHDVSGSGEPGSVYLLDLPLKAGQGIAAAFEAYRKELSELRKKLFTGFVSMQTLRYLGAANTYLGVLQSSSREMLAPAQTAPELQAFNAAHPATEFVTAPNLAERYEVIQRI